MRSVLTASAFLEYLEDGPKSQMVQEALQKGCVMSALAWSHVLAEVAKLGFKPEVVIKRLESQGLLHHSLEIVPFTFDDACLIAKQKLKTDTESEVLAKRLKLKVIARSSNT